MDQSTKNTVVVLIDMQQAFLGLFGFIFCRSFLNRQIQLIRKCSQNDIPVVVLEYGGYGKTVPRLMKEVRKVPRYTVMQKHDADGFSNERLYHTLEQYKATQLILTGVNKSVCVMCTAQGAIKAGYRPVITPTLERDTQKLPDYYIERYRWERDNKQHFDYDLPPVLL